MNLRRDLDDKVRIDLSTYMTIQRDTYGSAERLPPKIDSGEIEYPGLTQYSHRGTHAGNLTAERRSKLPSKYLIKTSGLRGADRKDSKQFRHPALKH